MQKAPSDFALPTIEVDAIRLMWTPDVWKVTNAKSGMGPVFHRAGAATAVILPVPLAGLLCTQRKATDSSDARARWPKKSVRLRQSGSCSKSRRPRDPLSISERCDLTVRVALERT